MLGLLKLLGRGGKAALKSKHAPAVAATTAAGVGTGYGLAKTGVLQFDPWGDKQEAYEQKKGSEFIKQEAYDRSSQEAQEAYARSQEVEQDPFGYGIETPEMQQERIHEMYTEGLINQDEYNFLSKAIEENLS